MQQLRNVLFAALMLFGSSAVHAQFATGYVDVIQGTPGGNFVVGWACNVWYPQYTYLQWIEVYESGPYGTGTLVHSFHPEQDYRGDTTSYCGGWSYNGFHDTNGFFSINANQYYWVYIRDYYTNERVLLGGTPLLVCPYGSC